VYNEKSKKHPKKNALNPLVIRHFRGVFSQNQVQNSGFTTKTYYFHLFLMLKEGTFR